jgi:hypothetical protein
MWGEITIGTGPWGNMAILVRDLDTPAKRSHISQNDVSYWISGASYLNVGMRIAKNTKEGAELTALIKDKASDETISDFLDAIVVKNIAPEVLKGKFDEAVKNAFNSGCEHQAALMRHALLL